MHSEIHDASYELRWRGDVVDVTRAPRAIAALSGLEQRVVVRARMRAPTLRWLVDVYWCRALTFGLAMQAAIVVAMWSAPEPDSPGDIDLTTFAGMYQPQRPTVEVAASFASFSRARPVKMMRASFTERADERAKQKARARKARVAKTAPTMMAIFGDGALVGSAFGDLDGALAALRPNTPLEDAPIGNRVGSVDAGFVDIGGLGLAGIGGGGLPHAMVGVDLLDEPVHREPRAVDPWRTICVFPDHAWNRWRPQLNKKKDRFRACYDRFGDASDMRVELAWSIEKSGEAHSFDLVDAEPQSLAVAACVIHAIRSIKFSHHSDAEFPARVRYPILFSTPRED